MYTFLHPYNIYCNMQNKRECFKGFQRIFLPDYYWIPVGAIPIYAARHSVDSKTTIYLCWRI
jgi:hypothetical protein